MRSFFAFVVAKLGWLARVPVVPQLFDTLLLIGTALLDWRVLRVRDLLELEACRSLGVGLSLHRFGGLGFTCGRHEVAHLHGNGLFDAFVGAGARQWVVRNGMASPHHVFPRSGWVSFWIQTESDLTNALELMREAQRYRIDAEAVESEH